MIPLDFKGPFPLFGDRAILNKSDAIEGIYLWTVLVGDVYKVNYVGQSNDIIRRLKEETDYVLTLKWTIYDLDALRNGSLKSVYTPRGAELSKYIEDQEYVTEYYLHPEEVIGRHLEFLKSYRIFYAGVEASEYDLRDIESRCIYDARCCSPEFPDNKSPHGYHCPIDLEISYSFSGSNVLLNRKNEHDAEQ